MIFITLYFTFILCPYAIIYLITAALSKLLLSFHMITFCIKPDSHCWALYTEHCVFAGVCVCVWRGRTF